MGVAVGVAVGGGCSCGCSGGSDLHVLLQLLVEDQDGVAIATLFDLT